MPMDLRGNAGNTQQAAEQASTNATPAAPKPEVQAQAPTASAAPAAAFAPSSTTINTGSKMNNSVFSVRRNRGISRSSTSEAMKKILESLDKISAAEKADSALDYTFIPLDGEKDGLNISAVVVAAALKAGVAEDGQKHVGFHILLLANTSRAVTTRDDKVGNTGVTYERPVLPTDGMDDTMIGIVNESLARTFPGAVLHSADWEVVPSTLNLESEDAVRNVAANATTAVWTILATEVGGAGWNIQNDLKGVRLVTEIKKSHDHFVGIDGLPVRASTVIEMREVQGQRGNRNDGQWQFNTEQRSETLVQMTGFYDLVNAPSVQANSWGGMVMNQPGATGGEAPTITYRPRFVVTNIDSDETCDLTLQLLAIGQLQAMAQGNRHIIGLIEQHRDGEAHPMGGANLRDLGAMGLEVPQIINGIFQTDTVKERFPTQSAGFSDQSLAALIQTYVSSNVLVSMDVPEGGPSTWMLAPFMAAARGNPEATADIFAACDILTGGLFTPLYKQRCGGTMPAPVFDDNLVINNGVYMENGKLRDLRDIGYLEVLNFTGDRGLDTIIDWSNLQANVEVDENFRATEALKILQGIYMNLQLTGRSRRITFYNQFLMTLSLAVHQAGVSYELKSSGNAPTGTTRMVNPYLSQQATNLGTSGAFVPAGYNKSSAATTAPGGFGRFGYRQQGGGNY